MCGIFCAVGTLNKAQDSFIKDMFVMDSVRGPHSCGIINVSEWDSTVGTFKRAVQPHDFLSMQGLTQTIAKRNKLLVGHNRWATKGAVNNINAHPFTIGHITGVHNGTLTNQSLLPDHKNFSVDSENIIHAIAKQGIEKTWANIHGPAALMWYDESNDTFNMIRNEARTLYYCYSKDRQQFYAASEKYMLMAALSRNSIEFTQPALLKVDKLFTFKTDMKNKDVNQRLNVTKRTLAPYQPPKGTTYHSQGGWDNRYAKYGEYVDFYVDKIEPMGNGTRYTMVGNEDGLTYLMEVFKSEAQVELADGECARAKVTMIRSGKYYLGKHTLSFDSEYVAYYDTAEQENLPIPASKDETCCWCGDPIINPTDSVITTGGQVFCTDCITSNHSDIDNYVEIRGAAK